MIFYEAPHRIIKTLNMMLDIFGDRDISISREITKKFETIYRGKISNVINLVPEKGEFVIVVNGMKERKIDDSHIIYINFEFIENEELQDYKVLNKYIKDRIKDDKIYYVFLDEVQNVDKFELVVNSLRASLTNISIFITGSNSKLLTEEISTVLSGRYVSFNINPLNYKEYVEITNKNPNEENTFWDFVQWGGLPNRTQFTDENNIKDYLHSVFDSIILRDVVSRLGLKDIVLFNLILQYIVDTIGREFSAKNIINFLKSEGREISTITLYNYLEALCKALIIKKIYRYDIHGKAILKTLNKYYVTDLGIAQIKNNNFEINKPFALENVVFNELITRGYEVYIGKTKKGEIDFIATNTKEKLYFQIAYYLSDEKGVEREFGAFKDIEDNYTKYVLSMDKCDFSKDGIIHKNIIEWLLER